MRPTICPAAHTSSSIRSVAGSPALSPSILVAARSGTSPAPQTPRRMMCLLCRSSAAVEGVGHGRLEGRLVQEPRKLRLHEREEAVERGRRDVGVGDDDEVVALARGDDGPSGAGREKTEPRAPTTSRSPQRGVRLLMASSGSRGRSIEARVRPAGARSSVSRRSTCSSIAARSYVMGDRGRLRSVRVRGHDGARHRGRRGAIRGRRRTWSARARRRRSPRCASPRTRSCRWPPRSSDRRGRRTRRARRAARSMPRVPEAREEPDVGPSDDERARVRPLDAGEDVAEVRREPGVGAQPAVP